MEKLYRINELATRLKVCTETIKRWEAKGLIPAPNQRSTSLSKKHRQRLYTEEEMNNIAKILTEGK